MLRLETKARARALQILYAWELQGRPAVEDVVTTTSKLCARHNGSCTSAAELAVGVVGQVARLDDEIAQTAEHWRMERLGAIERNILRIGVLELLSDRVPPRVAIDEGVRLARWFAGPKAPAFVNGVLDGLARRLGRL